MKVPKKVQKVLNQLKELEEVCKYACNGSNKYKNHFTEINSLIIELSLEKKVDHARLAKKLKAFWENNH